MFGSVVLSMCSLCAATLPYMQSRPMCWEVWFRLGGNQFPQRQFAFVDLLNILLAPSGGQLLVHPVALCPRAHSWYLNLRWSIIGLSHHLHCRCCHRYQDYFPHFYSFRHLTHMNLPNPQSKTHLYRSLNHHPIWSQHCFIIKSKAFAKHFQTCFYSPRS